MQAEAIEAVRAGVHGVHVSFRGMPYEATGLRAIGADLYVETQRLNGERGPTPRAAEVAALVRTYEEGDE